MLIEAGFVLSTTSSIYTLLIWVQAFKRESRKGADLVSLCCPFSEFQISRSLKASNGMDQLVSIGIASAHCERSQREF